MAERPMSITAIAGLFVALGLAGIARLFFSRESHVPLSAESFWILALSSLAVFIGLLLLTRRGWARWLSLAWIATHIGIGFLNSLKEASIHALFFVLIAYLLFRGDANSWFRSRSIAN